MVEYILLKDIIDKNKLELIEEIHIKRGLRTLLEKEEEMVWSGDNGNYVLIDSDGNIFEEGKIDPAKLIEAYKKRFPGKSFFLGRVAVRGDPFVMSMHPELKKYAEGRL